MKTTAQDRRVLNEALRRAGRRYGPSDPRLATALKNIMADEAALTTRNSIALDAVKATKNHVKSLQKILHTLYQAIR